MTTHQQIIVVLGSLAHNALVWAKRSLHPQLPGIARFGIKRLVCDVFGIAG